MTNSVPVTHQSTRDRIEELRLLEQGWLDGEQGSPANQDGLTWLKDELWYLEESFLPWIFPTVEEEDVLLEWSINYYEISLWINTKTKHGHWYSFNVGDADDFKEYDLDLSTKESWFKIELDLVRLSNK
jgi:hypothetical protein